MNRHLRTTRAAPQVAPRKRGKGRDRSEAGDTLIEVLLALVVLALAALALMIAFSTSISASAEHRRLASDDTVLATASQEIISAIQNQPSLFSSACTTPVTNYPDYGTGVGFPLPAPYTAKTTQVGFDVQYLTLNPTLNQYPILWWSASAGTFTSTCVPNVPQLITISLVGTSYTNSFVVDYPIGSSGGTAGSGSANQLVFLNNIVGGYAGSPFTTQPIVAVEANGVPVSTDLSPVTLSISSGTGVISGCTGNEVLGIVTFSGCTIGSGGNFQLEATDGSLNPAFSNSFSVTNSNYKLVFTTQPKGGVSGSAFSTPPVVSVENTAGSVDTSWQGTVTMTASGGLISNCPQATPPTVVTITVVNGLATMPSGSSGCYFAGGYFFNANSNPQITATQYTLTATATPNTASFAAVPTSSNAFSVSSFGPAAKLSFTVEPTGVASSSASAPFSGQPTLTVEDAFGNVVTSATNPITIAMFQGATSETITGCSATPSNGTYAFTGCHGTGTVYLNNLFLTATSPNLTSATSTNFNITGVASQLLFVTSPTAGASASTFTVQPVLVFEDASNNVVTAQTSLVTLAVSPASGTLSTCTGLTPNAGNVKVGNCVFTGLVGTSYTLTASGGGVTSLPSSSFSPTGPGPATQLMFTTEPVAGASQSPLTTQPAVKVEDSAGNIVSSSTASIVLTSSGNGVVASCTGMTASAGIINTSNCTFAGNVGTTYFLTASSGTLATATSTGISPTAAGPMSQILLSGCSANFTSTSTCTLSATLKDMFGNIETLDNASAVTFAQVSGSGSVTGLASPIVASGTTSDVITGATAGGVTVNATSNGVASNQVSFTVNAVASILTTSLPGATQTGNYSQQLTGTNGTTNYTWTETGSLPTGLTLSSSGLISGTVGAGATSSTFTVTLTDADGVTTSKSLTITVNAKPSVSTTSLATATQTETLYSQTLTTSGGTSPYTWIETGSLPSGLTLSSGGVISGTVGAGATTSTFTIHVTDANNVVASQTYTLTVNTAPSITPTTLLGATQNGAYSRTLATSGGTTPFGSWSLASGALPTGLTLNTSTGAISGTVGASATSTTFTIHITDANNVVASQTYTLTVNTAPSITSPSTLPGATQTGNYSQQLTGTNGTTNYTWTETGSLPTGLTLSSSGLISGTVGAGATSSTFTVTLTDANGVTATKSITINVSAAPSVSTTSLATATQTETLYSQTLTTSGGTSPFGSWSLASGALPSGLTLSSGGVISGTVGAGATTSTFTIHVTDANNVVASQTYTLTVNTAPSITPTTLLGATQNGAYSRTLATSGGTTPFGSWSLASGALPTGLTLNTSTGAISGTVGASATSTTFTIHITDANNVVASQTYTLTVNTAPSITSPSTLPGATQTGNYSQQLTGTNGTTNYTWTETGSLPTGLTLSSSGLISGTVGAGATSSTFTVTLTDANGVTATKSITINVNAAPSVSTTSLATATQTETLYNQTLTTSGGTTPFGSWSLASGALPSGLTLSSGGVISGTVGAGATTSTFTIHVTDANGVSATKSLTIIVNVKPTITPTTLATATQTETLYSQTLTTSGGTSPFGSWSLASGALPSGLTLSSGGVISGTVGAGATTSTFTIHVTDANNVVASQTYTLTVNTAPSITPTTLLGATQNGAYSRTLATSGGTTPFGSWSLASGALPTGLTLNTSTGAISGTVGASATSTTFTIHITDANNVVASQTYTLTVNTAPSITSPSTLPGATQTGNYSQQLTGTNGTTNYTWTETGSLPTGLTLSSSGLISGTVGAGATSSTFTVTLTDANGVTATKSITINVSAKPTITAFTPPPGTKNSPYSGYTFVVTNGTAAYTWTETGSLPTGLTLSSGGVLSGTPTARGTKTVTVTVTDANGVSASQSVSITIN